MADNKSSQSKTEPPTQKRLRDLRRKGQVAKSRDVPATAVVIAGVTFLALAGHLLIGGISAMVNEAASFDFRTLSDTSVMTHWAASLFTRMLVLTLPFVLVLAAVSALASFLQTGPVFSLDPVKPQVSRINPIEGARRLFSLSTVVEFLKLLVKALVLALLLWMLAAHWLPELLRSHWLETSGVLPLATAVLASLSWLAAACFMCTTVFDVWFQRWNFSKQNRMTFDEVRREHKETEGDPHVRNRRRRLHQEINAGAMLQDVRRASVVIVNPTHIAVALQYVAGETDLPVVVAKGQGALAAEIRRIAEEERIPIVRDVGLARGLQASAPLNQYIPDEFLEPVAAVLRWVRSLDPNGS